MGSVPDESITVGDPAGAERTVRTMTSSIGGVTHERVDAGDARPEGARADSGPNEISPRVGSARPDREAAGTRTPGRRCHGTPNTARRPARPLPRRSIRPGCDRDPMGSYRAFSSEVVMLVQKSGAFALPRITSPASRNRRTNGSPLPSHCRRGLRRVRGNQTSDVDNVLRRESGSIKRPIPSGCVSTLVSAPSRLHGRPRRPAVRRSAELGPTDRCLEVLVRQFEGRDLLSPNGLRLFNGI